MPRSVSKHFADGVTRFPHLTLAAYLGDPDAVARAKAAGVAVPKSSDFRRDRVFDPNPHRLNLPEDHTATTFLVRTLAFWGWRPLVGLALTCSEIQLETPASTPDALLRSRAVAAESARAFQANPTPKHRAAARAAADACAVLYGPFEDDPDSTEGHAMWLGLGASWFAAETAAQDFTLTQWDGAGPIAASATWGNRNSVWPQRAADAAARVSSHSGVRHRIVSDLIAYCRKDLGA